MVSARVAHTGRANGEVDRREVSYLTKGKALYGSVLLSMLILALPSVAGAQSLAVPFFVDNSPVGAIAGGPAPNEYASWIRVQNLTASTVTLAITYRRFLQDPSGTEETYFFDLGGYAGVSWRPYADDPAEGAFGQSVPNYTVDPIGSAVIESGVPNSLSGNVLQLNASTFGGIAYGLNKPQ